MSGMNLTARRSRRWPAPHQVRFVALSACWLIAVTLLLLLEVQTGTAAASPQDVVSRKIWDAAPSNAFTDLIWYHDRWLLVFREGTSHTSMDGTIRVLASSDGDVWQSVASLAMPSADLRDPKLSITRGDVLMLNAAQRTGSPAQYTSTYWTSQDGSTWNSPTLIGVPNLWLWSVAWHGSTGYSIGYRTTPPYFTSLYTGNPEREIDFTATISPLLTNDYVNETTFVFVKNGDALALTRRDPVAPFTSNLALLGSSASPYTAWSWRETNLRVGGPEMLHLDDGRIVVGARLYTPTVHTALLWLDPDAATLTEFASVPSGGDTGYPGLVHRNGRLWVSYYSSHEGKSSIYFGSVEMPLSLSNRVFMPMITQ